MRSNIGMEPAKRNVKGSSSKGMTRNFKEEGTMEMVALDADSMSPNGDLQGNKNANKSTTLVKS